VERIQDYCVALKRLSVVTMPSMVGLDVWRLVAIVKAIDRTASVPVKPCSVTAKGDQVSQRDVGVVPHDDQHLTAIK
jgi:hypothetical protein